MNRMHLSESSWPVQTDESIRETTVGELLREVAGHDPCAPALVEVDVDGESGRRWAYGELLADSERLAHALCTRFSPVERIVVWAPNIPEWVLMEYACAFAGLVLVTANPAFRARELRLRAGAFRRRGVMSWICAATAVPCSRRRRRPPSGAGSMSSR